MIAGILASLWCAALWYGADTFTPSENPVDRLRNAIVLGIAIPGVLGFAGILYPAALWACAIALVALRFRRPLRPNAHDFGMYATLSALAIVLWAPLCRPLLEGDSLLYHYPNAAVWVQHHSIWTSQAPYWYYPGGSELLASGFIAAAGRFTVPLAGVAALLLLTARLYERARDAGAHPLAAASIALAFAFMPLVAFQGGSLDNDLLLAAFFAEAVVTRRTGAIAVTMMIKPFGFIEAAIVALVARTRWQSLALAAVPFLAWNLRTLLLLRAGGIIAYVPPYLSTAIIGNLTAAMPMLVGSIIRVAPAALLWVAFLVAGSFYPTSRRYAIAGCAVAVLYLFLPFSYQGAGTNYLANGSSLRFFLSALACGALIAAMWMRRLGSIGTVSFAAVAVAGATSVVAVFWNDSATHRSIPIAVLLVMATYAAARTRPVIVAAAFAIVVVAGANLAQSRYLGFYDDGMRQPAGNPTHVFTWLAASPQATIVANNIRLGMIEMVAPADEVIDGAGLGVDGCELARSQHALWFVGSNEDPTPAVVARLFARARTCGEVRYADGAAIVIEPSSLGT